MVGSHEFDERGIDIGYDANRNENFWNFVRWSIKNDTTVSKVYKNVKEVKKVNKHNEAI